MHLVSSYQWIPSAERKSLREFSFPVSACNITRPEHAVSIYDEPERESEITCQACLNWLNDSPAWAGGRPNRLLVTRGGIEKWIEEALKAGDTNLHYIDIPVDDDSPV
jgi:hypothetical protein